MLSASSEMRPTRRAPNRWGVSIRKEAPMSQRKIDAAVQELLAQVQELEAQ